MCDRYPSASRGRWTGSDGQTGVSPVLLSVFGQTSGSGVSVVFALLYSDSDSVFRIGGSGTVSSQRGSDVSVCVRGRWISRLYSLHIPP